MNYYFVDYENVKDEGLGGVEFLDENDRVIVFYSQQACNLSFERHLEIMKSPAAFEYLRIGRTGKNYLDFQLSTYLGYLIASEEPEQIVIVTRDTGYDSVVDFWRARDVRIVRRGVLMRRPERQQEQNHGQLLRESAQAAPEALRPAAVQPTAPIQQSAAAQPASAPEPAPDPLRDMQIIPLAAVIPERTEPVPAEAPAAAAPEPAAEPAAEQPRRQNPRSRQRGRQRQPIVTRPAEEPKQGGEPAPVQAALSMPEPVPAPAVPVPEPVREPEQKVLKRDIPEEWRKKVRAAVKDEQLAPASYTLIYRAIAQSASKMELNASLCRAFKNNTKGGSVYRHVKEIYEQYQLQ